MAFNCNECGDRECRSLKKEGAKGTTGCFQKKQQRPQTEQAEASSLSDLLASMNEFIDTIRHLQYEAQEKGARLESDFQTGKDYAYGDCAERLTKIVKAL